MGLLEDESKGDGKVCRPKYSDLSAGLMASQQSHIVETEPFSNTFGPKAQRKRPRLDIGSIEELGESSASAVTTAAAGAVGGATEAGGRELDAEGKSVS